MSTAGESLINLAAENLKVVVNGLVIQHEKVKAQLKTCEEKLGIAIACLECIPGMAGNPEAAEGCRLIIRAVTKTLAKIKKLEE